MAKLISILSQSPVSTLLFTYCFAIQSILVLARRFLLPHFPVYQSLRTQIQKAYYGSAALHLPNLAHRLPVSCPEGEAKQVIGNGWRGYLIPGTVRLESFHGIPSHVKRAVVLFAHGGGYARGEARMYRSYMRRWVRCAAEINLEIVFLSVEYPLTPEHKHPTQRDAFLNAYRHLLERGIAAENVVFMGDSAGGGICINSALEAQRQSLPQPACTISISPWIDMSLHAFQGGNLAVESDYIVVANTAVPFLAACFLGDAYSGTDPEANPLFRTVAEGKSLNPQLIIAGSAEFALTDAKEWAAIMPQGRRETRADPWTR